MITFKIYCKRRLQVQDLHSVLTAQAKRTDGALYKTLRRFYIVTTTQSRVLVFKHVNDDRGTSLLAMAQRACGVASDSTSRTIATNFGAPASPVRTLLWCDRHLNLASKMYGRSKYAV